MHTKLKNNLPLHYFVVQNYKRVRQMTFLHGFVVMQLRFFVRVIADAVLEGKVKEKSGESIS